MAGYPEILLEYRDNTLDALVSKILKDRDTLPPAIVEMAENAEKLDREYIQKTEENISNGIL